MAQEENYIAIVSQRLSKPGDTRYVIIDKQTQQEVDTCNGRGYKSPQSAHKSFAFKQRRRSGTAGRQNAPKSTQAKTVSMSGRGSQTVTVDAQTGVTKVNTWSGYARRGYRQWTCQEDTPRPPELFDSNK